MRKSVEGEMRFSLGVKKRGKTHAIIIHIRGEERYRTFRVRLVCGDVELLLGMDIISKIRIVVDFGARSFRLWWGGWL